MEGGCLDTKPWGNIVDECFEDAVKGLYFCVDIPTAWVVLPVANGPWVGDWGFSRCYYVTDYIIIFYDLFKNKYTRL